MVSIFTGLGAGFERGSGASLGGLGVFGIGTNGLSGENVSLNAANGNLLITRQDEFLVGRGPDAAINRTYNSFGALDENGDNWRMGTDRRVFGLTGSVNKAGSTVKRVSSDGTEITYTYGQRAGGGLAYWATDGSGAHDRLDYNGSAWIWTDGDTLIKETYAAYGSIWRITKQSDVDGNTLTFTYSGANLNRVTTANGEYIEYSWSGNNITQIKTVYSDLYYGGSKVLTRVRYGYDKANRLTTVTIDLSPEDNSISDGKAYTTTYRYHGNSKLIAAINQTDGSEVQFSYDGKNRVTQIVQLVSTTGERRTTNIAYSAGRTDITDPRRNVTSLFTDSSGRLIKITTPPQQTGAASQSIQFSYDRDGNVFKVIDAAGGLTQYQYDSLGNATKVIDATGRTTNRTFNSKSRVISETVTGSTGSGPSVTLTTRYVYDTENHLIYSVSAEGRVTRYEYYADGTVSKVGESHSALYSLGSTPLSEATMSAWWSSNIKVGSDVWAGATVRSFDYDRRGSNYQTTLFGSGLTYSEGYAQKLTYFDQTGQIRFRRNLGENWEFFYYDGLGRLTASQDQANATTSIVYRDASTQTIVTTASGYVTTKTYNKAGELISETDSGSFTRGGTSSFKYDSNGQLRAMTDASSRTTYFLYDRLGRKTADISQDGFVVEYRYDAVGRVNATARYNNRITLTPAIIDPKSEVELSAIRPGAHAMDIWEWQVYDAAGRVVQKILGDGSTTIYQYDDAGRLIKTLGFGNPVPAATIQSYKSGAIPVAQAPSWHAFDNANRNFYDRDGLLIGTLAPDGGLTRYEYDGKGRKVAEYRYVNTVINDAWSRFHDSFDNLLKTVTPNSRRDIVKRYVYDGMDQLRFAVDGLGRVTEYRYFDGTDTSSAFKGVRRTIEHATPIAALSGYTVATVKAAIASQANNANNRSAWLAYDVQGRLGYSVDANGAVVGYTYDIEGRVTETRQFATLINMSVMGVSNQWKTNIDAWAVKHNASVRVTRNFYAARGDLRFTMDAEGYVTQFEYDAEGRVTTQSRFSTALNVASNWTIDSVSAAAKGTASVTTLGYDSRGQLVDTWDANGTRRNTGFHANGMQAWDTIGYKQASELRLLTNYDAAGRFLNRYREMDGVRTLVESAAYDGLGNIASRNDANGTITRFTYDKSGRVKTIRDALGGVTTYVYDASGQGTKVTDARGNSSYNYYDAAGQLVLSIDAEGYATRTTYNAFGEVASVTQHKNKVSGGISVDSQPTITTSSDDNVTTYTYDRLGRLTRVTDALGAFEEYRYNSFGERVSSRNKLGGVTTYTYDERGLLVSERLPIKNHLGEVIINRFEYDSRGNRTKVIEAAGLAEQRITTYQYDAGDRLTHKISEARQTVANGTASSISLAPTEQYFYDRRGNVIEKRGPDGARQLLWYNNRNQVSHSLSALGTLTQNIYDADGNVVETRVYETPVALPADATGPAPTGVGTFRVTQYSYDALNRRTEMRVPEVTTATLFGSVNVTTRTLVTSYSYDALGNVTRTTDPEGRMVHNYYDKLGRKTSEVDQEHFRTDWTYDAIGNVTKEIRYANRVGTAPTIRAAPPTVSGSTEDRITTFGYDKLGRRIWLQRANVQVHDSGANGGAGGAHKSVSSIIRYVYNGLNQVVRKTEATGETVSNSYDVGGRLTQQRKSSFTDFQGNAVSPTIQYAYDGLGNLRTTTQLGQGDTAARVSTFVYGTGGLLKSATDAAGFVRTYQHDVAGRVTREEYERVGPFGNVSYEASGTDYDLEGRVVAKGIVMNPSNAGTWTRGDGRTNDTVQLKYNAFGEVIESGINGIVFERNDYDKAGRLWRTNSGDGVWKYYLYNGTGQRTVVITSSGRDIAGNSLEAVMNLWGADRDAMRTNNLDGVVATFTRYDARGQAIEVVEPQRELSSGNRVTLSSSRGYNAFGELVWEQNAGGYRIDYTYNTMGRQIKIESPSVQVTSEAGISTAQRPTEYRYFDASGRLVASRDANGNLTRFTLLGGTGYDDNQVQVLRVDNPDGSYSENQYDVRGDLRISIGNMSAGGPQGYVTQYTYDRMGRRTTVTHPGGLSEYFSYDGLGQQIQKYNSFLGTGAVEQTGYDQQGRVIYQRGASGDVTNTAYQFTDVGTWGLGTFGGWIKGTTYANGKTTREWTDVFGRTTATQDMSDRMTWNYFDLAGRMVRKNSNGTGSADLNLTWYNTGKLASQKMGSSLGSKKAWSAMATEYGYDSVGNLVRETTTKHGVVAEWEPPEPPLKGFWTYVSFSETVADQTAAYDGLGRMVAWNEVGGNAGLLSAANTSWQYDANGNIRSTTSTFSKLNASGNAETPTTKSDWFKFDSMNRVTLDRGILVNGQILRGGEGITIVYNGRGERAYTVRGQEIALPPVPPAPPPPPPPVVPPPPPPPPANRAPVANADSASGEISEEVIVAVLSNDDDPDGDLLSISGITFDPNYVHVIRLRSDSIDLRRTTSTGRFVFLKVVGVQAGTTRITYKISDGRGGTAESSLDFTVKAPPPPPPPPPNKLPIANGEAASGQVNTGVFVAVLDNDYDPDGDPVFFLSSSFDANLVEVTQSYDPETGQFLGFYVVGRQVGTTNITYTISDGKGGEATGTLAFTVTPPPNRAPVTSSDGASGQINTPISAAVLANDYDPDGDPLDIVGLYFDYNLVQVTKVLNTATGRYDRLEVTGRQIGTHNIYYTVSDGKGGETSNILSFTVTPAPPPPPPPNRPPIANGEAASGEVNSAVFVAVLDNDYDPDGDPVTFLGSSFDTNLVEVTQSYDPETGQFLGFYVVGRQVGTHTITYTISDGKGGEATGTLAFTVTAAAPPPPPPPPPPDYALYVLNNPDVYTDFFLSNGAFGDMAAFGARHYQLRGMAEGRQLYWTSAPPPPNFSNYVLNHGDLYAAFYHAHGPNGDIATFGAQHYKTAGMAEGRQLYWSTAPAPPNFVYYVLNYPDLVTGFNQSGGKFGDMAAYGARHYVVHGIYEGRQLYWSQPPSPPPPPPPPPDDGDDGGGKVDYRSVPGDKNVAGASNPFSLSSSMSKPKSASPQKAASTIELGNYDFNLYFSGNARDDYEYDAAGRLVKVYHAVAGFGAGDPTSRGGQIAEMAYDALGRMRRQTDFAGPGSTQVAVDRKVEYDAAGRATFDTTRTRQSDGKGGVLLVDTISRTTYDTIGTVESVSTQTNRYSNANAYSGRIDGGQGAASGNSVNSTTSYFYDWYQGAVQTSINYSDGKTSQATTFTIANEAGQAVTKKATINDGRSRTVIFDTDVSGQVIRRRESDKNTSQGDPSSVWYRFAGRQMGMVTNNGGWEGSYAASVTQRQTAPLSSAPGAFANGATVGKQEAQFSSNLEVINSYSQGSVAGTYVVRAGDSLQGIAQNLWGDSGLWYKLAQANGLSGNAALFEGQSLRLPAGVIRNTYNASTITPYNPAETLGDVTPSTPQAAPPKKQKCGALGQILLVVIAIAVTYITKGATKEFFVGVFKAMGASAAATSAAAASASAAIASATGSAVSQAVGVATGIQEKFSWSEVSKAFFTAGVAGPGEKAKTIAEAIIQAATTNAISQGINVTLGLQDKFSWAAVAAAGVGVGVGRAVGDTKLGRGLMASGRLGQAAGRLLSGTAAIIASAATRSAIDGSDFGDNARSAMPSMVGSVIGDFMMGSGDLWNSPQVDTLQFANNVNYSNVLSDAPPEVVVVYGKRRGWLGSILKAGADAATGAFDDLTRNAFLQGIQKWSGNDAKINGPRADGTYSPRDTYLINAKLHASISALSAVDAITLFGKNGTVGGAAYDAYQNRSAIGFLGVAIEAIPLLRPVASVQSLGGMGAKAAFSVPRKALDIIPEGPLVKLSTGSNTNVMGRPGVTGPNPFGGADLTIAGGVNFQVAVPTARVGGGVVERAETRILFGQKRVGPTFGVEGRPDYLAGRSISDVASDLRSGALHPDQLPIDAFRVGDNLVSANTRSLSALSEAGLSPTVVNEIQPTAALLRRLRENPMIPNAPLPGPRVPVTPSQSNLDVLRIIELPR